MEGRIEDNKKAQAMAEAEKPDKDLARDPGKSSSMTPNEKRFRDELAEKKGEIAGEKYDEEQEKNTKNKAEYNKDKVEIDLKKFHGEEMLDAGRRLLHVLRDRESEGLTPIIEPGEISRLGAGLRDLEEGVQANKVEEVSNALVKITRALDGIGRNSTHGALREDSESLSRAISALKAIEEQGLVRAPELGEDLNAKLRSISSVVQTKWLYLAKKRELIKNYENRRY